MAKYPSQLQDKFNLRLPDGMKDIIAERAKANGRSMNSEIIQMLQDVLDSDSKGDVTIDVADKNYIEDDWVAGIRAYMEFKKGEKGQVLLTIDLDKIKKLSDTRQKKDNEK
ncbi:TPA: Arc family DNA-binding protein [Proteus mirabilis]|uniref:Arc family DNA-binding protein n=1 Tax=Proteus mirabilis TaxID=584 RepID=UPI0018C7C45D|nr:Arc family DNA-binding protein [Proteus mirabilis]DAL55463.1 MAG TPA_asm: Arc-like DNA binding domain protein [Caudoviricetes sp.]EKW7428774.1 Arc family DNA-binding protein [Proteus mirabilis]MBG2887882.1 Arc family DNA-binding protein [Proteus mirabilis]MBI6328230.1 Arc family DNA-binding protein [Proteus mirabilis]MBI6333073.1 Arc family DNA-binding protein [Proteus mirabilis]